MTTLAEHIIVAGAENHPLMLEKSMYYSWGSRIHLFIKGKKHGRMMLDSIDNGPLDIWDRVKMLMKGTELSYQERECRLYNLFDKFAHVPGETLYEYYWRFSQLINDMHTIGMAMQQVQFNTKFLNALPSEWSKFITDENHEIYLNSLAFVVNYPTLYIPSQSPQHSGEDLIKCINKEMEFLSAMASRFPPLNNQLITSSNNRNQVTIQNGRVTVQKFKEDNIRVMLVQETKELLLLQREILQPRNAAWFREKLMLAEAQEASQILDEEQLAFLVDPGISKALVAQQIIPQNSAFQTDDLDAYDSDYDDLSSAKAVLMVNLSSYDPDVLSEVPYSDSYPNDMINQDMQEMQYSEQTHVDDFENNKIHSGSNIIPYSQYLQESQDAVIRDTNLFTPNDLLVLSLVEQMTDHVAHLDKENQTNKMVNESLTAELERYKE
ncbi:hypothetical protein Tco_0865016 [Tanacetum coccineum]